MNKIEGYVSLHTHSTFSVLDGFGTPEDLVKRAKELGHQALAITDHGNVSAHPQLERAAKEAGIKPIYGCEFYCVPSIAQNVQKKNHVTVLAKNPIGYENLLRLVTLSYQEGHFYYRPTIDMDDLIRHKEGLIVLSGCLSGIASVAVLEDKLDEAKAYLMKLQEAFGEDFCAEIQPLQLEETAKVNAALVPLAAELGIPLVCTNDVHFVTAPDRYIQSFLGAVRRKVNMEDWGIMDERCTLCTKEELLSWNVPLISIVNACKVAEKCESFDLPVAKPVKFGIANPYEVLVEKCREGWLKRKIPQAKWEAYTARVLRELELIKEKDFVDYFLIVADMIDWAKSTRPLPLADETMHVRCQSCRSWSPVQEATETPMGLVFVCPKCETEVGEWELGKNDHRMQVPEKEPIAVGPARGSAAGSLVSYLLGITEIDPIEWDLLFERFIDVSRSDAPDIDVDIDDERRDEVKLYLQQKYGKERVANIAGYSVFKFKSLLDDVGRCYRISKSRIEEVKEKHTNVEDALKELLPGKEYLAKAEGMIRQFTIHAAGVVVASDDLSKYTAITKDGILLDYRDAEKIGLMKIDILGLRTLRILRLCLGAIGKDMNWLYTLPLDDEKTIKAFSGKHFAGVFQYEGHATKGVCQRVKPKNFRELIDINALSRPAPLQSGATERYINQVPEDELHPVVTKYTASSRGQILFQEQVMKILKEASTGLDWADITAVRKLITKKQGLEKLEGIKQRFIDGFDGNPQVALEIFNRCAESGSYGFNLSHATAYTHLGYYCMYLKMHYPLEFYWANMAVEGDKTAILREFAQQGGVVKGVKFGRSKAGWSIDNGCLRAGYTSIKGIGEKTAMNLEMGKLPGQKTKMYEKLVAEGVFSEEENTDYMGYGELVQKLEGVQRDRIGSILPGEQVRIAGRFSEVVIKSLKEVIESRGEEYGKVKNPECEHYVTLNISDETGTVAASINRFKYADAIVKDMVDGWENKIYLVAGEYNQQYRKVYIQKIKVVE